MLNFGDIVWLKMQKSARRDVFRIREMTVDKNEKVFENEIMRIETMVRLKACPGDGIELSHVVLFQRKSVNTTQALLPAL